MGNVIKVFLQENRRRIGYISFLCLAGIILWYTVGAGVELYHYFRLNRTTPATIEELSIGEVNSDQFAVQASYSYEVNGKNYKGSSFVLDQVFRNPFAAEPHLQDFKNKSFFASFNEADPNISSIDKRFPIKKIIYTGILFLVFIYFLKMREVIRHGRRES